MLLNYIFLAILGVFTELLPYFPGRSTQSLDQRYRTLKRWAKLWRELREVLSNQINVVKLHSELTTGQDDLCSLVCLHLGLFNIYLSIVLLMFFIVLYLSG